MATEFGAVTLDGALDDWAADTRLDTAGTGTAGYGLYGDVQGDAFVFAIDSDSVAIGAGTTIWLDTDLDRGTGYQIFGFTGGAEYNVNVGSDGVPRLYTGAEGQTFVSDLDFVFSADNTTVELAIPKNLITGVPSAVRLYADVNNSAYLPNEYSSIDFVVTDGPPVVSYGAVTLDGDISDWAAGTRLDTPATGTAGYGLYGDVQGDAFVFAIDSDSVAIGAGTTIWLDTDLDRGTGYQIFGFTGGAEYNVNFGSGGIAKLYTGAEGQTFVADLDYRYSADNTTVELAVSKDLLAGAPTAVRVYADVNNSAYLPNEYSSIDFVVTDGPPVVSYGAVTLDGDIGEWAAGTRLDTPATGTAGYALYGDVQGDAFVFAIDSDSVAIGAGTTVWLDTDLDRGTGYQIFGFTGGAEYNVNFGPGGVAKLYTGADGQTFVADLDYSYSADNKTIELAVSNSLLAGAPEAVRVYADVNNSAYLPNDYNIIDFIVGTPPVDPPPPPVTYGAVTLDGDIGEWAAGTRLDTPATGTAGYGLYGDVQGDAFVFAIDSDSVAIGAGTTIWLDSDLNRNTGHQIWGFTGGAEYNVNFGSGGIAKLYTGAAGETFVANLDYHYSADNTTVELAVSKSLLAGEPSVVRVFADVNDSAYLPSSYSTMNIIVGSQPVVTYGAVTIDGDIADWPSGTRLDTPATGTAGYGLYGDVQGDAFVFAIDSDSVAIGTNTTIWLDSDLDRGTGYQIFGFTGGAEYNVNIGADGFAKLYTGAAGETFVADLDYFYSADNTTVELAVSKSLLAGAPSAVRVFADVNDSAFLPNSYSNMDFIVGSQPIVSYGSVTLDGDIGEWAAGTRLDTPATGTAGYALYGDVQGNAFVFAIDAETVAIGANTTIWLDTDLNRDTGYQIFGLTGGAEYNVNILPGGIAKLYSGAAGETFVANLDYHYSADKTTIELAVPKSLLAGAPVAARVFADVNDSAYLPNDYGTTDFVVNETQPVDPSLRVGIVYSETTAANFYDLTSYGQLFMAAQNQAMQAGVPFDLLTETDLTDVANLKGYDAIIFPSISNVKAADLPAITTALTTASKAYGVGMIAAGDFLTNDETGVPVAGNPYAAMNQIFGVTYAGFGQTDGVELRAGGAAHPILEGYAANELVGDYGNASYVYYSDLTGSGQSLFSQTVVDPSLGTVTRDAAIATTLGGHNVHFASDAIIGNNNILGEAIEWAVNDTAPDIDLSLTRGESLFYSRNDMDISQEYYDVVELNPGIYDVMLPIVEKWYQDYNFVGSYYVNIGANPPDQQTDWSISGPYYQQLLALGNGIGTHSYTHPEDTNLLTPAQIQYEFQQSKAAIEANLGIVVSGAAVPGAPEKLPTSLEILQYFDYLSGGYSGTGAGYPGAFGYLTPGNTGGVYLAPNMSFDFSLIGFKGLTVAEAEAVWAAEYAAITDHGKTPIIAFPWHDYGPTDWELGDPLHLTYTLDMFTNVIARAAADGTEFVTGEDLAGRIDSFAASGIVVTANGNTISANVASPDAGKFALTLGDGVTIDHVANWYAWDGNKVFLPKSGGQFDITTGSAADDVTRLAELPMRAELVSASGNGKDLDFSLVGRGTATVDLKAQGTDAVVAVGADKAALQGERLALTFDDQGTHTVAIDYNANNQIAGSTADEGIFGGSDGERLDGGSGDDTLFGGGGADTFAYGLASGDDTILDFASGTDTLELFGLGFIDSADAYAAFDATSDGLTLSLDAENSLLLANLQLSQFAADDILLTGDTLIA